MKFCENVKTYTQRFIVSYIWAPGLDLDAIRVQIYVLKMSLLKVQWSSNLLGKMGPTILLMKLFGTRLSLGGRASLSRAGRQCLQ